MESKPQSSSMMCKIKSNFLFLFNVVLATLLIFLIKSDADKKGQKKQIEEISVENSQRENLLKNQQIVSQDREGLLRDLNTAVKELKKVETTTTTTTTTPEPVVTKKEAPKADSKTKSS
jgi:uncharacterized membrane protein